MALLSKPKTVTIPHSSLNVSSLDIPRKYSREIDLSTVMVGVLVIGIIGGVFAATIYAYDAWAEDSGKTGKETSQVTEIDGK